ncbi:MAG: EamA family transporter [Proteobacteria bacterium]|nr:EamA family transporter [Pseudomonadota bacterium]MDE3207868.1 EamA family transporter [Pseudomonadota bacterium]
MKKAWLSPVLLVFLSLIWGYNWVVMKRALDYTGPFTFATLRMLLGAGILFIVLILKKQKLRLQYPSETLLLGLFQTTAFTGLSMWALVAGGAGNVAILVYTMPFWVMILAWPLLKEKINLIQAGSAILAILGLGCFFLPSSDTGSLTSKLLALTSGIVWAISVIIGKRIQSHKQVQLLSLTAWQMLLGGIVLAMALPFVQEKGVHLSLYFWFALLYNAGPSTALGWLIWLYLLRTMKAGTASLGLLLAPIFGLLAAALELHEIPSPINLVGIAAILCALAIISIHNIRYLSATIQE